MLEVKAGGFVGSVDPVVPAAVQVPGLVRLGPLILQDRKGLARRDRPGAGKGLATNADRREPEARGGRVCPSPAVI